MATEVEQAKEEESTLKNGEPIQETKTDLNGSTAEKQEEAVAEKSTAEEVDCDKPITEETKKKIMEQIHYYFGNYNLPRDKFLREEIKKDDGWVSMETMLNFKRLANLSKNTDGILSVLSSSTIMEVNNEKKQVRRLPSCPLPDYGEDLHAETIKRTIYVKGFPKEIKLDTLLEFFNPYGPYETVRMRYFVDKSSKQQGFKGSVLVVFPSVEEARIFINIDDVKYKKTPLLIKWHSNYLEQKKAEIDERIARKEARNKKVAEEQVEKKDIFPKGVYVHMSGIKDGTYREHIKEAFSEVTEEVAFVDFNKGQAEGFFRLSTADSNKTFCEEHNGKVKVNDALLVLRVVEGEEEEVQMEKAIQARNKVFSRNKRPAPGRGGGRGGGGNRFKRRKNN